MATYRTMTVDGGYGSDFTADSDEDAIRAATAAGYRVLDVTDSAFSDDLILVIAD